MSLDRVKRAASGPSLGASLLNRADTFPGRKSPGQVVIAGLAQLDNASDFSGRLDLYVGVLTRPAAE